MVFLCQLMATRKRAKCLTPTQIITTFFPEKLDGLEHLVSSLRCWAKLNGVIARPPSVLTGETRKISRVLTKYQPR
jgi:hypothetical protein